jgi:hypothetical protein
MHVIKGIFELWLAWFDRLAPSEFVIEMSQLENVVSLVTASALNHENSNPNGEALTIHKEKDRVRGQEELPTPQRRRIDEEPVDMPQTHNVSSTKQLQDSVDKLEALHLRAQRDDVRADCKKTIAFLKAKIAAIIVLEALQALPIANEQVPAKVALQGEIVTAKIAAAPVESRTNQAGVAVAASKSTKQPVPANFNPATCPCPGKNKNPYAHFRSEKHELWMARNAAAAVGIDQPIAAVEPHLQL